jgi:hypothetical protein
MQQFLFAMLIVAAAPIFSSAFSSVSILSTLVLPATTPSTTCLYAVPTGPLARAKKLADPKDYNRVVEQKMKREKWTRPQAEEEYNNFLENPPFYYALDQKKKRYKEMGYKDLFEGMIGEAEKEGRGDEVREQIKNFRKESNIKASGVLVVAITSFLYFRSVYLADPENFLPGI